MSGLFFALYFAAKNNMNNLKQMIDLLGVTLVELRSGNRERRLADARSMLAAALPITQCQLAALFNCSQAAVCAMRKRHRQLFETDLRYKEKFLKLQTINTTSL